MQGWYQDYVALVEAHLEGFFQVAEAGAHSSPLREAMGYSLLGGGKRVRPVLTLEFCRVVGGEPEAALSFAAAVEMIHSYSLIHDDLPAMDDDVRRRGRPTCHVQFGEAMAILAGDALQAAAFRAVLSADLPEDIRCRAGLTLARAAGEDGMVAGQVLDLAGEARGLTEAELLQVHQQKTAALIQAAAVMGVLAGGGSEAQVTAASRFAKALGMAFQIRDDMLDCTGDAALLGKPIGSDAVSGKTTFVTLYGLEGAAEMLGEQTDRAKAALRGAFDDVDGLCWFADWLLAREY
ncbi:MAG: polyprenyl synthetase family protein [Oscillospiraceae bacterium]|nr:polyprenyl synthetase family protein [Oscillospiraceae bacterium]